MSLMYLDLQVTALSRCRALGSHLVQQQVMCQGLRRAQHHHSTVSGREHLGRVYCGHSWTSTVVQRYLFLLRRTMLNVQMYRANYTAFGNKRTSKQSCYNSRVSQIYRPLGNVQMMARFVKLESSNKFVLKSFCSQMLCKHSDDIHSKYQHSTAHQ